jgi:hypothetical protein
MMRQAIHTTIMQVFVFPTRKWPQKSAKNTKTASSIFVVPAFSRGNSLWLRRKPRWDELLKAPTAGGRARHPVGGISFQTGGPLAELKQANCAGF